MYTQCPDCATSFRVTAEVLKQAGGKVRCGGCGNAFNALAYLSESKPEDEPAAEASEALPELKPDPYENAAEDAPPAAISPEQSAALLKTLDELAGDDIRLEDTGIEWRLMAEEEDAGEQKVDEMLEASPTPVDQFLTQTPNEVEASEVFDEPEAVASDIEIIGEAAETDEPPGEVLRFDDNTGLPEDFDYEAAAEPEPPSVPEPPPEPVEAEPHPQVDLALGDPDEWGELLSEAVIEPESKPDDGPSIIEELEALEAEISSDADAAPVEAAETSADAVADTPLDIDTQFDLQAEALGLDFSEPEETAAIADEPIAEAASEAPAEPDPTETSIEDDLIAAAFEAEQAAAAALEASGLQLSLEDGDDEESIIDDLSALDDENEQPSIEEELAALDEPGDDYDPFADDEPSIADELIGRDAVHGPDKTETDQDFPDSTGALEFELAEAAAAAEKAEVAEAAEEAAATDEPESDAEPSEEDLDLAALMADEETTEPAEDDIAEEAAATDQPEQDAEPSEEDLDLAALIADEETTEPAEDDVAEELALLDEEDAEPQPSLEEDEDAALTEDLAEAAEAAEHDVPPQSEEEQTINAMIDQDLMRMAIEDEEGFASTIVFEKQARKGKRIETEPAAKKDVDEKAETGELDVENMLDAPVDAEDDSVETIIMEGSFARTAEEQERIDASTDEETGKPAFLAAAEADGDRGAGGSLGRRVAMIGGAVFLLLGLGGQFVHQSRAELATIPAINDIIAPIYRALGMPITPEWDVSAWRFEVTRGSTGDFAAQVDEAIEGGEETADSDGEEAAAQGESAEASGPETLTIYSRIGNESSQPLPYPLVSVSLTDRFEETIGNVVLEPAEYLTGNFDPRRLVPAGETFDAVISIESPSMEATGFKLNVCYRQEGGLLRCAIEDFK